MPAPPPLPLRHLALRISPSPLLRFRHATPRALSAITSSPSPFRSHLPLTARALSTSPNLRQQRLPGKKGFDWEASKEWLNEVLTLDRVKESIAPGDQLRYMRLPNERYPPHFEAFRGLFGAILAGGARMGWIVLTGVYFWIAFPQIYAQQGLWWAIYGGTFNLVPLAGFSWIV